MADLLDGGVDPAGALPAFKHLTKLGLPSAAGRLEYLADPNYRNEHAQWLDKKMTEVGEAMDAYLELFKWGYGQLKGLLGR